MLAFKMYAHRVCILSVEFRPLMLMVATVMLCVGVLWSGMVRDSIAGTCVILGRDEW